jgi:tRNA threonylcarbamoyladenosine biosynthesis protein TsaB
MAVVGFDTATADTAVCVLRGDDVVHEELLGLAPDGSPRHSTALLAEVERAVALAGGWDEVGSIAVGLGPGSFTGVRIGIASARGLAASTGIPTVGICTLDALGRGMSAAGSAVPSPGGAEQGDGGSLAVLDARRGEAFAALYSPAGKRLWDPFVATPEALAARVASLSAAPRAAGSGAVRFRDELASQGVEIPDDVEPVHHVAARHICALAATVGDGSGDRLEPIYIRLPDAQRWRERDTSQRAE